MTCIEPILHTDFISIVAQRRMILHEYIAAVCAALSRRRDVCLGFCDKSESQVQNVCSAAAVTIRSDKPVTTHSRYDPAAARD
jgi:hypothetical protein